MGGCITFLKVVYYILVYPFLSCIWKLFKGKKKRDFSCDIVLITGGAQGLGKELALEFSNCGATVVLWDIDKTKLQETCSEITAKGKEAFGYVVDCSNKEQIYQTAEKVREEIGNVSVLVNNVGILLGKLVTEMKDEEFERTMTVNFTSHYWTTRAFLPWMLENDYGYIVEISSISAYSVGGFASDYHASKAAQANFSQSLRWELIVAKKRGVSVTCVCPGPIRTTLIKDPRVAKIVNHMDNNPLDPSDAAERIITAMVEKQPLVIIPRSWKVLIFLYSLMPSKATDEIFSYMMKSLNLDEEEFEEKDGNKVKTN